MTSQYWANVKTESEPRLKGTLYRNEKLNNQFQATSLYGHDMSCALPKAFFTAPIAHCSKSLFFV